MNGRNELAALAPVADALGVDHYIGGSVASSIHGVARTTLDIDIVAALRFEHVERLVSLLGSAYYADAAQIRQAIEHGRAFNLVHLETMYKVDVFMMKSRRFDETGRHRTVLRVIAEGSSREFAIASPEDTILSKLELYEAGGGVSERQWSDIVGVMKVQGDAFDQAYLDKWAGELSLTSLLARARSALSQP